MVVSERFKVSQEHSTQSVWRAPASTSSISRVDCRRPYAVAPRATIRWHLALWVGCEPLKLLLAQLGHRLQLEQLNLEVKRSPSWDGSDALGTIAE